MIILSKYTVERKSYRKIALARGINFFSHHVLLGGSFTSYKVCQKFCFKLLISFMIPTYSWKIKIRNILSQKRGKNKKLWPMKLRKDRRNKTGFKLIRAWVMCEPTVHKLCRKNGISILRHIHYCIHDCCVGWPWSSVFRQKFIPK